MIKWGIIGAGNIANRFANSLEEVTDGELHAVANRTIEKAETFKANHPLGRRPIILGKTHKPFHMDG